MSGEDQEPMRLSGDTDIISWSSSDIGFDPEFEVLDEVMDYTKDKDYASQIQDILSTFAVKCFKATDDDAMVQSMVAQCIDLMQKDYEVHLIDNKDGTLCSSYPKTIIVPVKEIGSDAGPSIDVENLKDLMKDACCSRCRKRFVVPVILYDNKYVARSATVSMEIETWLNRFKEYFSSYNRQGEDDEVAETIENQKLEGSEDYQASIEKVVDNGLCADVKLLKAINIKSVVDLMVEQAKFKYFLTVSSSEKAENAASERYKDFTILQMPFPGCEFFAEFNKNNHQPEGLVYNWPSKLCDAELRLPDFCKIFDENWTQYKTWDIVKLNQAYMKFILKYLNQHDGGMLVHCISGWDRTPLFISTIRLNLWADGLIHKSLNAMQILYLTLAYDWALFGHNLHDRIKKMEDILMFCFNFLKYFESDEFSLIPAGYTTPTASGSKPKEDSKAGSRGAGNKTFSPVTKLKVKLLQQHIKSEPKVVYVPATESIDEISPTVSSSTSTSSSPTKPVKFIPVPGRRKRSNSGEVLAASQGSSTDDFEVVSECQSLERGLSGVDKLTDLKAANYDPPEVGRAKRLSKVRTMFYKLYYKAITPSQFDPKDKEKIEAQFVATNEETQAVVEGTEDFFDFFN